MDLGGLKGPRGGCPAVLHRGGFHYAAFPAIRPPLFAPRGFGGRSPPGFNHFPPIAESLFPAPVYFNGRGSGGGHRINFLNKQQKRRADGTELMYN
jgi:hypothetical protein